MKIFKNAVSNKGRRCDVAYEHVDSFAEIPDDLITKAHAVCFCGAKILLVHHSDWNIWGIPGGTREPGESIEETVTREIKEETNCAVIDCRPISYQKIISPDGEDEYRVQYICKVEPISAFVDDPAGNINKILWIDPDDYEEFIEGKEIRGAVLERAISVYRKSV